MDPRRDGRYRRADAADAARTDRASRFTHPYVAATVRLGWARRRNRGRSVALLIGYRLRCQGTTSTRR